MRKERLKIYRQRKQNKDKRKFTRIYNMEMPIALFCLLRYPKVLVLTVYNLIIGKDVSKAWFDMLHIARIRKQIMYFRKRVGITGEIVRFKYHISDTYIEVRVYFGRKIKPLEYEQLAESCTVVTHKKKTPITREHGYYAFKLLGDPVPKKEIHVDKKNHLICIGQDCFGDVMWDFDAHSCALIAGKPRNGKTSWMMYLINSIVSAQWELWVIDGKDVDYIAYEEAFDHYIGTRDIKGIYDFVESFRDQMLKRYDLLHDNKVNKYDKLGLSPCFLLIDEYLSVVQMMKDAMPKKDFEYFQFMVGDLVRRGPASGFQVVLGMQRADAVYITGETRSNMQLKIVVGNSGKDLNDMMFEVDEEGKKSLVGLPVGYGWYQMGDVPNELAIPYYDSVESEIKPLLKEPQKKNGSVG